MIEEFDHEHYGVCDKLPCPRCGMDPVTGLIDERLFGAYSCAMCNECWLTYLPDVDQIIDEEPDIEERLTQ